MNLINTKGSNSGLIQHILLVILLAFVAGLFVHGNVLWRWDNLLYDAQLSFWSRTVSDDIIVIAIDDESLNELGHWPWPRSTHARLIDKLELESPRVIGLDIIFSEPDEHNPQSDKLFANAIENSGKIVLPVFMSQQSANSYPIEALPLPEFSNHAAALGHVHIDLSDDGIARKVYLREGIGKPHWLHYSLAVLSVSHAVEFEPGHNRINPEKQYSPMLWSREDLLLIPFAGPPGHFQQIGYSQVLSGHYQKDLFRDKIVLIGTTAEGMGDALPTPLSGNGGTMPGVEIVANIIDSLLNDLRIIELNKSWLIIITAILVALPLLIYPYLSPGSTLLVLFGIVLVTIFLVAFLLWLFGVWLPLSTVLLFQFISYPLWSWRRLELAMRHINAELDQVSARQKVLSISGERNFKNEINFIGLFIPIKGWVLQNEDGSNLLKQGNAPVCNLPHLKENDWSVEGDQYWTYASYHNKNYRLGLSLARDAAISEDEMRLLNGLIATPLSAETDRDSYAEDVLQEKIKQVQAVGIEYEKLRRIIDDSLSGMADGVLICSCRGQVMFSNRRAGWYLCGDDNADMNGHSLSSLLDHVELKNGVSWNVLLKPVLFRQQRQLTHARHESGRDLMIELSPLKFIGEMFDGFVVNFSDISLLKASERKRNEALDFLSHDLRSPLSSMLAMLEISKNKSTIEEMKAMLTVMEKNTYKTLHLAEQFLQLSRANTNENIKFYDIDFNSVVLNAVDRIWALSNKLKVTINHDFEQDECWIHAEADLLERAIINLLSNAIKHSEAGSQIRLSVHQNQNVISCCVSDQGSGIAAAELPHLFEMFRRVHGAGVERKQGVGLGLAFVDAVAKRHSGTVEVESKLGKGSKFCLKIPKIDPVDDIE
ncbi:MAG: CHASE2 domain-containing protein [Gammaproteobacteria bacterium]|nr:CHASE2 domain-containing protein [Gammaproteobacteria bacterium]